jgi:hypothetical protein
MFGPNFCPFSRARTTLLFQNVYRPTASKPMNDLTETPDDTISLPDDCYAVPANGINGYFVYDCDGNVLFTAPGVKASALESMWRAYSVGFIRGERIGRIKLQGELRRLLGNSH